MYRLVHDRFIVSQQSAARYRAKRNFNKEFRPITETVFTRKHVLARKVSFAK